MDVEQKETTEFFLESWLNEAVGRCNSFLDNVNRPFSLHDNFQQTQMFEEHYVLTAIVMSVRFARQLVSHAAKDLKEQLENFIDVTKDAVDVRNMREHSDEYFLGIGRKQNDFLKGSVQSVVCDMSSSIHNEHGYMLGNLISLELVRDECQSLLSFIQKKLNLAND